MTSEIKLTPMMAQWKGCKEKSGSALLFFRMGDFYECFYEDAQKASEELDIALTKRQEIPMAGVPWQQIEGYIEKLIQKGLSVAIAEQVEDPKEAKGIVKREIVRVLTPGTHVTSNRANYLMALSKLGKVWGLAVCDLSTGEFRVVEIEDEEELRSELFRIRPKEALLSEKIAKNFPTLSRELREGGAILTLKEEAHFDHERATEKLLTHFKVHTLDSFGLKGMGAATRASGALIHYLQNDLHANIHHLFRITPYSTQQILSMDRTTQATLELTEGLLPTIDETLTPMGSRLMANWTCRPLLSPMQIEKRQSLVIKFLEAPPSLFREVRDALSKVRDLERLTMRVSTGYVTPRDFATLRASLQRLPQLAQALNSIYPKPLDPLTDLYALLEEAIVDEPPARLSDGEIFRETFDPRLKELRALGANSKTYLAKYQQRVREETGIKTLRVGYNKIFGYYLEVSKGQAGLVPSSFIRKQTLVNAERFISEELKAYEEKALTAQDLLNELEGELYLKLRRQIASEMRRLLDCAAQIAKIDCLVSFAKTAREKGYVRPIVTESDLIHIEGGRHPVIEKRGTFVPNEACLDTGDHSLSIITGPNMAGKSTYLRQVALITILAQMGSFVPATTAHIGIVDKIFTRIGASDNLAAGQSTFMVEMQETANILHNATPRSLILLDEIGRGTSTYDGISIAWAVAEHLLRRARTLFATHYWELTCLEGAINLHVAVSERDGKVLFLHRVEQGAADKSYGIHVAKLAGLPLTCIGRAEEILKILEKNQGRQPLKKRGPKGASQLAFF